MWGMAGEGDMARSGVSSDIGRVLVVVERTVQIRREDRVDHTAMRMPGFSMVRIGFGMNVDQWHHKHPDDSPASEQGVETRLVIGKRAHKTSLSRAKASTLYRTHQETVRSREAHRAGTR